MSFLTCHICKKEFRVSPAEIKRGRKFCSQFCMRKSFEKRIIISCSFCRKDFEIKPYEKKTRKYCSNRCVGFANKTRIFTKEHRTKISLAKEGKPRLDFRGINNPRWNGGTTSLRNQIRYSINYKLWRKSIFERDNFTCKFCRKKGCRLHVDHIKSFSKIFEENNIKTLDEALTCEEFWNIDNGRTLCLACHKKTESYLNKYHKKVSTNVLF